MLSESKKDPAIIIGTYELIKLTDLAIDKVRPNTGLGHTMTQQILTLRALELMMINLGIEPQFKLEGDLYEGEK